MYKRDPNVKVFGKYIFTDAITNAVVKTLVKQNKCLRNTRFLQIATMCAVVNMACELSMLRANTLELSKEVIILRNETDTLRREIEELNANIRKENSECND